MAGTVERNVVRAFGLYARGLGMRGRMTYPEVRGLRTLMDRQLGRRVFRAVDGTLVEQVRASVGAGQVRGEWVEAPGHVTRDTRVVLYVHGGAFVAGSPRTHRGLTAELAGRLERSVFSLDYRLAPGHRYPAAPDDVLRAYSWLLDSGVPASGIVVMGDSAGGHLVLGLSPRLRRAALALPAAVVAFSPVVDPSMRIAARWEREHGGDGVFDARTGRAAMRPYIGRTSIDDPELLLTADELDGLPPTLVQASESEMLVADARAYVDAASAAGSEVQLQTWPRQMHVFQIAFRLSRSARAALDAVVEFVTKTEASVAR